jgi:Fe-S cluster biogenesis protein NfuA
MADTPTPEKPLLERVQAVIDTIRPLIQADGGDIQLVGIEDGVVQVRLHGACVSCPMSRMTLKMGVEQHLRELIPEINSVEAVA